MSIYEKYEDEEGEYLQNVENFDVMSVAEKDDFNKLDFERVFGGRDYDVEETLGERFLGLTEMFPPGVRETGARFISGIENFVKNTYGCVCNFWWSAFVMGAILFAPLVYEYERSREEERLQRRQLVQRHELSVAKKS